LLLTLEQRVFMGFVIAVSLAMAWIIAPYYGAILWGVVTTIVFWPLNRNLRASFPKSPNFAAFATLMAVIAIVIVPTIIIGTLLIEQAISTYANIESQKIDFGRIVSDFQAGLPRSVEAFLDRNGFGDMQAIQKKLATVATSGARIAATQALSFGQGAFSFAISLSIMLYLTFFLLRDGSRLTRTIGDRIPLAVQQRRDLFDKFATVIRATIKGSIVVAVVQGMIGGIVFWVVGIEAALLWGVVMGFLSLVPAIGTGLIWVPVAVYLFATGQTWQGAVLTGCGIFIIGMVDNVLRPILVGKDTRMPDYVVLISTVGGISVMGINGFIIGPVIAALFIAAWDIFLEERAAIKA
jgi:predicted PurR-regulated permease PerM